MSEPTPLEEAAKALFGNSKASEITKLFSSPILWGVAGFFIGTYSCNGKIKKLEEKISELEKKLEAQSKVPEEKQQNDLSGLAGRRPRKRLVSILN